MKLFHRHRWVPFKLDHGQFAVIPGAATRICEACACGKKRERAVNGHWTFEDLGWNIHEATFELNSRKFYILSEEPIKSAVGRLVCIKGVKP